LSEFERVVREAAEEVFKKDKKEVRVREDDPHSVRKTWCEMMEERDKMLIRNEGKEADLGTYYLINWHNAANWRHWHKEGEDMRMKMKSVKVLNYQGYLWTGERLKRYVLRYGELQLSMRMPGMTRRRRMVREIKRRCMTKMKNTVRRIGKRTGISVGQWQVRWEGPMWVRGGGDIWYVRRLTRQ
jgi:hypothetical protein